jgi:TonB-dependent starch-binding outer membrane protein SusC
MTQKRLLPVIVMSFLLLAIQTFAQQKVITGKVTDNTGAPVAGVTVTVKGTNLATQTSADGSYRLSVPENAGTLVFSAVGFGNQEATITGTEVNLAMASTSANLNEVVVVGYGTARKRDLTGAVASVKAKDFNQGVFASPDQLIQGKVAGVQVQNNSGAPGGAATISIRGISSIRSGNQPLIVVDGVPLSGGTTAPSNGTPLGGTPADNPLNFINPSDIASMDVLKDASATAIYGSRGANGVIMITTKKGQSGAPKIEFNSAVGVSNLLKRIDVLDGNEYRAALKKYNQTGGDFGGNVDALHEILRTAYTQNYNIAVTGGNENGKYRASAGYMNQEGIIKESGFKKYSANLTSSFKFTESKRLGLDFNLMTTSTETELAPISNDAGFQGSLIGTALQWNPTHPLRKPNDSIWIVDPNLGNTTINPLALLAASSDKVTVSTVLASISPSYKILKNLEYRMLYSVNYSQGQRKTELRNWLNLTGNFGFAGIFNNRSVNQQVTHTLSYTPQLTKNINLNAVIGYEYLKFDNTGHGMQGNRFVDYPGIPYVNYMGSVPAVDRSIYSYANPISELQSYFARASFNFGDRFLLTGTLRADGSTKFGANQKYGYFPSVAGAWNISNEGFLRGSKAISNLKLRASWGQTGNQEFPAGASQLRVGIGLNGNQSIINFRQDDLKWETNTTANVGLDFGFMDGRLTGTADYFQRTTEDLIFEQDVVAPGPSAGKVWRNLPAKINNTGFEFALNYGLIRNSNMTWNIGGNIAFLHNEIKDLQGAYETGSLSGQGISGATSQRMVSNQPLNVYYLRRFEGIDKTTGQSVFTDDGNTLYYSGSPNPKTVYGITTDFTWNKLFAVINMNGAGGQLLYNNTANSVLPIGNLGTRNIASALVKTSTVESISNPIAPSSRYLEKGDYMKLANATIGYRLGNVGKPFKNMTVTLTGQNLFVITKFSGFDPEVNVDKSIGGIPSRGIEYIPYPSARTVLLGLTFGL